MGILRKGGKLKDEGKNRWSQDITYNNSSVYIDRGVPVFYN